MHVSKKSNKNQYPESSYIFVIIYCDRIVLEDKKKKMKLKRKVKQAYRIGQIVPITNEIGTDFASDINTKENGVQYLNKPRS